MPHVRCFCCQYSFVGPAVPCTAAFATYTLPIVCSSTSPNAVRASSVACPLSFASQAPSSKPSSRHGARSSANLVAQSTSRLCCLCFIALNDGSFPSAIEIT